MQKIKVQIKYPNTTIIYKFNNYIELNDYIANIEMRFNLTPISVDIL